MKSSFHIVTFCVSAPYSDSTFRAGASRVAKVTTHSTCSPQDTHITLMRRYSSWPVNAFAKLRVDRDIVSVTGVAWGWLHCYCLALWRIVPLQIVTALADTHWFSVKWGSYNGQTSAAVGSACPLYRIKKKTMNRTSPERHHESFLNHPSIEPEFRYVLYCQVNAKVKLSL
jgi:hypothetical protein